MPDLSQKKMLGLVRDKFAKTKKVETDDVKLLRAHFAGGGFISKEMIGVIVFNKLKPKCHAALRGVVPAFPAAMTAKDQNDKQLLMVEKDGRRAAAKDRKFCKECAEAWYKTPFTGPMQAAAGAGGGAG